MTEIGPWNEFPHDVRSAASVASFRKKLKTYPFAKAKRGGGTREMSPIQ